MNVIRDKAIREHFIIKMEYIKTLGCRLIISAKRLKKQLGSIIKDILAIVGILLMIGEAASEIFSYEGIFTFYRMHVWLIAIIIVLACIVKNWDHLKYTVKIIDSPDVTITLKVCNALNNDGAVIIPTNSTFDTIMEDEFISKGSIQGQYQIIYFKNRINDLDKKLSDGLEGKNYVELKDGRKYKTKRYPIGTVSRISEKNKRAYFLADSDIDPKGIPVDVDAVDVSQSLTSLWENIQKEGSSEPYSIPLIGTGKARAKDVSRNEVVQQIILSFLAASKVHKITESLTICIYPGDFEKIEWDALCEFLKYQSLYANLTPADTKPNGTAETTPRFTVYKGEYDILDSCEDKEYAENNMDPKCLSEREQMMITLLTGNKMSRNEIAMAMALSVAATNRLIRKLLDAGAIMQEGSEGQRKFYVPKT